MRNIPLNIIIIKLGGSLLTTPHLNSWLNILSTQQNMILIAGGGVFADSVRTAQQLCPFSEQAAHEMALLAMSQYALLLQDICKKLQPFSNFEELAKILEEKQVIPIWHPTKLCMEYAGEIAVSWQMTSDSLAAWLAKKIGAKHLILIKSAPCPVEFSLETLVAQGLVDELFPHYAAALNIRLFSQEEFVRCGEYLNTSPFFKGES
ncbi:MAG: hypothetical protein RL368_2187 [Pseudomonadota bacterium]